jgi:hypothetical protein
LTINSNLDIQAGGALSVNSQGSAANSGGGHGTLASGGGSGGGHGGLGSVGLTSALTDGNGTAVAGLTLQPSGLASVMSDTNGSYSITVPPLWTGSVTPSGSGVIVPSIRNYSNLASNPSSQDYAVTTSAAFNLSGSQPSGMNTVNFNWYGLNGATYQLEMSSNLVDWAAYGPPYFGSNTPVTVAVPKDQSPGLFFRLHVIY